MKFFAPATRSTMLALCLWAIAAHAPAADGTAATPRQINDFTLNDHAGAKRALAEWSDKPVIVAVFLGTECPLAKLYGQKLVEIEKQFADRGVQFIGINSNQQDTLQELAGYGTKFGITFPLLKDPGAKIADQFGATRTPEAFVLDRDRVIRYQGRIDDQYGVGSARNAATNTELVNAIEALLSDKPVAVATTQPVGCLIGRRTPSTSSSDVTYAKDVAPVLQNRCISCHREGQIAPFALTEYEDVVAWADMCLEVIDDGRMPPWSANPAHGEFANDARLASAEKELFRRWVAAGTPEGNRDDLPPARQFVEGWQIPKPDAVYAMPEEFEVPANGTVPYQYFIWDPGFTEDKWVYGAEARPGNPEVVHHLIMFYIPPGQEKPRPEDPLFNAIAAFAPGMPAVIGPEEYALRIPAGSKLAFQVHYTPNGRATTDRSSAAVVFADPRKVTKQVRVAAGLNFKFLIPPFHPNYPIEAEKKFKEDTYLYTMTPHMHYRGKAFRFTAHYPDGSEEILLDVPRYDFNWQIIYLLKEPKLLPAGTVVKLHGHFDNSANNPLNPDPAQFVRWGDQTWDEMMLGSMTVSAANQDLRAAGGPLAGLSDDHAGGE
ncbi:redoxin domain-containing protein [Lacipirellula limnantheis]|uniref:Thiol-disulfide oxidoreductase ResA n=1 Tax=Lacipirellula limnantheis TaxID=2528024 RepID=A0A517TT88_9BACT|nr:redoxin domain-containing protein [Lacipirellula limnantheis]QDT71584.1 Thiol-disulfide oxidoreductase ResA [Lacipirellula limnantheis]